MDHANRPRTLLECIDEATFSIYGLIDHPCNLTLYSHGIGISHLSNLISVSLDFTSPHSSKRVQKFEVTSLDSVVESQARENMSFDLRAPSDNTHIDYDTRRLFRKYHLSEEERKIAASPRIWDGTLLITNTLFSIKIRYWEPPFQLALFLLKSEKSIIIGDGYGLSCSEIVQILEGLQIINGRKDIIQQYQSESEDNALIVAVSMD